MKTLPALLVAIIACSCSPYISDLPIASCQPSAESTANNTRDSLALVLDTLVHRGVPGVVLTVASPEGTWTVARGWAKIEDKTPMRGCHLQYLQSVVKTYLAVAILQLYEQGRIDLDAPMTRYLPEKYARYIDKASNITVRMLLNHTSGVPEYNSVPAYITVLLQHPEHHFTPEDYLQYIKGKPLNFAPGSKYSYRNTNYVLLALMADAVDGDHSKLIADSILNRLGLRNTFYRGSVNYLDYPQVVNTYWDRYSDGLLENASLLQRNNVRALIGDDGIVATPEDALAFLQGLMQGKLLKPETLALMQSWTKDAKGNPTYGLGLDYGRFGSHTGYGHSGGGIGAGCQLFYFPDKDTYMFVAMNLGTVTESPLHGHVSKALDDIYRLLLD